MRFQLILTTIFFISNSVCWVNVKTEDHNNKQAVGDQKNYQFCEENVPDWLKMISRSLATLNYYESHLSDTIIDVGLGTRLIEAQINILLNASLNLNLTILQDLKELHRKSKMVSDYILDHNMNNLDSQNYNESPEFAERMKKNLQWITSSTIWESPAFKQWKTLGTIASNIQPEHNVSLAIDFLEYYDECSFGIFENCSVSDLCIDHLWKDPDSGYLLTHQVLFHHILLQKNCYSEENKKIYESQNLTEPKQFVGTLCRIALLESTLIESLNYPDQYKDVFVELILLCSLAGYDDFMTRNWTNIIVDWAGDDGTLGCYSPNSPEPSLREWDNFFVLGNRFCSVHMGSEILGLIGLQLRYFLEMCYDL